MVASPSEQVNTDYVDKVDNIKEAFLDLFFIRRDCFATLKPPDGISCEKQNVTLNLIRRHLAGVQRIGSYSTALGDSCQWGCIDDDHTGHKKKLAHTDAERLYDLGPALIRKAQEWGMTAYLERSKRGGWHVWIFAGAPVSAALMRRVLRALLAACGFPMPTNGSKTGPESAIELFPMQDEIRDGYGNSVFLPFFGGDQYGMTVFVQHDDPEFKAIPAEEFLAQVQRTPVATLVHVAEKVYTTQAKTNGHARAQAHTQQDPEQAQDDGVSILARLTAACPQFKDAFAVQENGGLAEEDWHRWVHTLSTAGYPDAARTFSQLSGKHDRRSDKRIDIEERDLASGRAKPPVRCSTFGCSEEQIRACFNSVVYQKENGTSNNPMMHFRESFGSTAQSPNGGAAPEQNWDDVPDEEPKAQPEPEGTEFQTDSREDPSATPEPPPPLYPCPDHLWIGIFEKVAALIGKRSWEIWAGTYAALSAVASRNLHYFYYTDHIFGMNYVLLLCKTAAGKGLVVNTARSLLPDNYSIAYGLQSGPALIPLLTDDSLENKTGRLTVKGRPTMLFLEEWSRLLQVANIQNATVIEDLNALYHRQGTWSQARSHKTKSGGNLEIKDPTLTICGTSTIKLFTAGMTEKFIYSGGLNRYLVLPGDSKFEAYTGQMYSTEPLRGMLDHLVAHAVGHGVNLMNAYSPDAWAEFLDLQNGFFLVVGNDPELSDALRRLHVHFHHIALICAWSELSPKIEMRHVFVAKSVIATSYQFLLALLEEQHSHVEPGPSLRYEMGLEQKITEKVRKEPGIPQRKLTRDLHRQGSYKILSQSVEGMLKGGLLLSKTVRNQVLLFLPKSSS